MKAAQNVLEALQEIVDNVCPKGDPPLGGVDVVIRYCAESRSYCVTIETGEATATGEAPTLGAAILAASFADEMDSVVLGKEGQWLCPNCRTRENQCLLGCDTDEHDVAGKIRKVLAEDGAAA